MPIVEFASSVFNPYFQKDIDHLENVQKTFLRIVFRRSKPHAQIPNYTQLLEHFKLESLEIRRFKADLILFHKSLFDFVKIDYKNTFIFKETKTRNDTFKIFVPAVSNQIRFNSFFIKVPRLYSQLPAKIRKSSPKEFIKLLDSIDLHPFLSRPTPGS